MNKRLAICLMLSFALAPLPGCAGQLAQTAGEDLGKPLGKELVQQLPSPDPTTIPSVKGGDWCAVMAAKGWPKHPTQAEVDSWDHSELVTFVSIADHGVKYCGWKP